MIDELQRLRDNLKLCELLTRYAGTEDREAWLDRVMHLEGLEAKELVKLHGELIAHGWVEQNTGVVSVPRAGECPGCYRTTSAGRRALNRSMADHDADEAEAA